MAEGNTLANGVENRVDIALGTLPPRDSTDGPAAKLAQSIAPMGFNVIAVNILAEVISELVGNGLADWLAPNGVMIAAGIIDQKAELVVSALLASGLNIIERRQQGDWVLLAARSRL